MYLRGEYNFFFGIGTSIKKKVKIILFLAINVHKNVTDIHKLVN